MKRTSSLSFHSLRPSQLTIALALACKRRTNNRACTAKRLMLCQRRHLLLLVTETPYHSKRTLASPEAPLGFKDLLHRVDGHEDSSTYWFICEKLIGDFFFFLNDEEIIIMKYTLKKSAM